MDGLTKDGVTGIGSDLIVLETNSSKGLEVGISEKNVSLLNIKQSRQSINVVQTAISFLIMRKHGSLVDIDSVKTLVEQGASHKHAILLTVVRDDRENTTGCHLQ